MKITSEYRCGELEFRQEANGLGVVSGVIIRYGDIARFPWGTEEFRAGAFSNLSSPSIKANRMHQRHQPLGRQGAGLTLIDTPESLRAQLAIPDTSTGRDTVAEIKAGLLTGFSLQFVPIKAEYKGTHRQVISAVMGGFGVVDDPAYPDSLASLDRWDDYFNELEKRDSDGAGLFLPLEYVMREPEPEPEAEAEEAEETPAEVVRFLVV